VEKFCKDQVEKALLLAESEWNGVQPKEPLIRLRINRAFKDGEGAFEAFNLFRFGEQFRGRVANTKDIIQFKNVRGRTGVKVEQNTSMKVDVDEAMTDQVGTMKDVVVKCLRNLDPNSKERLLVQSENPLTEAMSQYVEKGVTDAIGDYVNKQIENMTAKLEKRLTISTISKEGISEDIKELADRRRKGNADIVKEEEDILKAALKNAESQKLNVMHSRAGDIDPDNDIDDVDVKPTTSSSSTRGRGRGSAASATSGRGSRGGGRGRGRGKAATPVASTPSIKTSFASQRSKAAEAAAIEISDDDEDASFTPKAKANNNNNSSKSTMNANRPSTKKKPVISFDSDSDEEFDPTPAKRGRR